MKTAFSLALLALAASASLPGLGQDSAGQQKSTSAPAATLSPELRTQLVRLGGQMMVDGQAYEYDRRIADDIGPRLTGSDNYNKAAEWAAGEFKKIGLSNAHLDPWTMKATWEPETDATAQILTPHAQRLHLESEGWSPSTPEGGVRGQVVMVTTLTTEWVKANAASLKDHIALVAPSSMPKEQLLFGKLFDAMDAIADAGARAMILGFGTTNDAPDYLGVTGFDGSEAKIPTGNLGAEDTSLLLRLLEHGQVEVKFSFKNRIRSSVTVNNVVADIPGSDPSAGYVIVGGHLDSWHPGTGAQDNGTGAASVLAVAQAVQAAGLKPKRTMRFILFGGEEEGLLGSLAYAHAHEQEIGQCAGVFITDTGSDTPTGWLVFGRKDEKTALAPIEPLLASLDADQLSDNAEIAFETDHAAFMVRGVPSFVLWTPMEKYMKIHHKPSDTFDKVDHRDLNLGATVVGLSAYYYASAESVPGHLNATEMEDTLKSVKALDQYKDLVDHKLLP